MSKEQHFDPMKEIQSIGEQISKTGSKLIRTVTGGSEELVLDMYETQDQLVIRTGAIDGLVKTSIDISLENSILTIALQTESEPTPPASRYLIQERRFGALSRDIELSIPVKAGEARAKVDSGNCLTITLPIDDSIYGNIQVTPVE